MFWDRGKEVTGIGGCKGKGVIFDDVCDIVLLDKNVLSKMLLDRM
jgi:hypothetical protein